MAMEKVISSYWTVGTHAANIASSARARDAHDLLHWFLLDMPIVPGLLGFHALYAADRVHALTGGRQFWFKSYVLTMFAAFGGSTLASILSGAPVPLFTHASNFMMAYITVAWYLVDQSRGLRAVIRWRPIAAVFAFGATAAKSRSIFSFIDAYVVRFPGIVAGAIALGGLAGSGGQLFISVENKVRRGFGHPSELSSPGWGFKSAYLAAAAYYVATDPEGLIAEAVPVRFAASAPDAVRYALSLSLCSHAALETLLARNINPTYLFDRLFYAVTRVRQKTAAELVAAPGRKAQAHGANGNGSAFNANAGGKNVLKYRGKR